MNQDIRANKGIFHFDPDTKKWGLWILESPEFTNIIDLVKWNREHKEELTNRR